MSTPPKQPSEPHRSKNDDGDTSDEERRSTHTSDGEDETDGAVGEALSEDMIKDMLKMKLEGGGDGKAKEPEMPKRGRFASLLGDLKAGMFGSKKKTECILTSLDLSGIVDYIQSGKAKHIVTMAGAGISTSAGIPDFRSPGTGLYDNLQKYNLPDPQAIFTIDFFRHNPQPFFTLAKELYPGKFEPTPCHYFIKLLSDKGLLLRHYTQNIDTLERVAEIPGDKLVEAHGTFHSAHCIDCKEEYTQEWVKDIIMADSVPTCTSCNATVKPDIVFFGENLPERFYSLVQSDLAKCDLLIILGTSLQVQPFASLVDRVGSNVPRLLINMEKAGNGGGAASYLMRLLSGGGMDFDSAKAYRDVARLGTCDEGCAELAEKMGWKDDLDKLISSGKSKK